MSKHLGCVLVTYEVLGHVLGLTAPDAITAIVPQDADDVVNQRVRLIVSGPSMPEHREGGHVAIVEL